MDQATYFPGRRHRAGRTLLIAALLAAGAARTTADALEAYVGAPDPSFNWKRCEQKPLKDWGTLTHLELVSQTWRGQFWSHHLLVLRPDTVRNPDIALLFVTGGSYNAPNEKELGMFRTWAERAGAMVAVLNKVPNQPLYDGRYEDALIAFTFDQYIRSGDPSWPLLFPMVKSAVRALDTLEQFAVSEWGQTLKRFVVSGASKRGWTTWLTAAADPRVVAIAPMVIDMLNMKAQLEWADQVYGKQSDEISDYTQLGLHLQMDDPPMVRLRGWVDPYSYRARYTLPKLILLGTNDPYWTVDALRHYWCELPEPKLVSQTPNAGHDLGDGQQAIGALAAFYQMIADGETPPSLHWTLANSASGTTISVRASQAVERFLLWTADSKDRDFRNDRWTSEPLTPTANGREVRAEVTQPAEGYRAFLVEAVLPTRTGHTYQLSTEARVTPDGIR
ncbi:MAG: PhoPQ-activated pathogenicity-like protein PqaA type [Verrucomicrobiales bacterium]|nr:PhoPQ-activated pathogenicity-like protein PqaA type [Verrucomicrobiales bacterium]